MTPTEALKNLDLFLERYENFVAQFKDFDEAMRIIDPKIHPNTVDRNIRENIVVRRVFPSREYMFKLRPYLDKSEFMTFLDSVQILVTKIKRDSFLKNNDLESGKRFRSKGVISGESDLAFKMRNVSKSISKIEVSKFGSAYQVSIIHTISTNDAEPDQYGFENAGRFSNRELAEIFAESFCPDKDIVSYDYK